jgi:hypothetical protein
MINKAENLNSDDVVCFSEEDDGYNSPVYDIQQRFKIARLFEFGEFIDGISKVISLSTEAMELLTEGIQCRVMTTRQQGWRFGKIRLKIELQFIPDEPLTEQNIDHFDSPLDEIRRISEL